MTYTELFNILADSETLDGHRRLLREYLISQLAERERAPEREEEIAYSIAGLMGTDVIINLPDGDPFEVVLRLAGILELPPRHRDAASTWERFATLVRALPDSP
jgi:hypothetical protein